MILKANRQEQEGAPIARIMSRLCSVDSVSYSELGQGARNPEGIWDWSVKKGNDVKAAGGNLTNREIYNYFADCSTVKTTNRRMLLGDIV